MLRGLFELGVHLTKSGEGRSIFRFGRDLPKTNLLGKWSLREVSGLQDASLFGSEHVAHSTYLRLSGISRNCY